MGNQGVPLRRGDILIHHTTPSPENKTEFCMKRGRALQELLGQSSAERPGWPAPLQGSECGRGGQTLGLEGRKAKCVLSEPTPCRVLWERQRR